MTGLGKKKHGEPPVRPSVPNFHQRKFLTAVLSP